MNIYKKSFNVSLLFNDIEYVQKYYYFSLWSTNTEYVYEMSEFFITVYQFGIYIEISVFSLLLYWQLVGIFNKLIQVTTVIKRRKPIDMQWYNVV